MLVLSVQMVRLYQKNEALVQTEQTKQNELSEQEDKQKELEEQETVVGMILLDNYDDVLDSIDENRLPILSALIDRKFNQLPRINWAWFMIMRRFFAKNRT